MRALDVGTAALLLALALAGATAASANSGGSLPGGGGGMGAHGAGSHGGGFDHHSAFGPGGEFGRNNGGDRHGHDRGPEGHDRNPDFGFGYNDGHWGGFLYGDGYSGLPGIALFRRYGGGDYQRCLRRDVYNDLYNAC
jgi:hypothetical protein